MSLVAAGAALGAAGAVAPVRDSGGGSTELLIAGIGASMSQLPVTPPCAAASPETGRGVRGVIASGCDDGERDVSSQGEDAMPCSPSTSMELEVPGCKTSGVTIIAKVEGSVKCCCAS